MDELVLSLMAERESIRREKEEAQDLFRQLTEQKQAADDQINEMRAKCEKAQT